MKRIRKESVLFAVLLLLLFVQYVNAVPNGIDYSLGPQGFEVTSGVFTLTLSDENGPHYSFYDNVENETEHHIVLVRAFEYIDENHDGSYSADSDTAVNPSIGLQTSSWSFGGFVSQVNMGETTELRFNLSSVGGFAPHQPQLRITLQNRINVQTENTLKLGFTIDGWKWSREDSSLAVVMALGTGNRGHQMQRPEVNRSPKNLTFENGFFTYDSPVYYGQDQAELNVSLGGATSQGDGEQILLCVPHFGNNTLECDPLIGLIHASSVPSTTQTGTTLLGTDRLLLLSAGVSVVIVVLVLLQRKRE